MMKNDKEKIKEIFSMLLQKQINFPQDVNYGVLHNGSKGIVITSGKFLPILSYEAVKNKKLQDRCIALFNWLAARQEVSGYWMSENDDMVLHTIDNLFCLSLSYPYMRNFFYEVEERGFYVMWQKAFKWLGGKIKNIDRNNEVRIRTSFIKKFFNSIYFSCSKDIYILTDDVKRKIMKKWPAEIDVPSNRELIITTLFEFFRIF